MCIFLVPTLVPENKNRSLTSSLKSVATVMMLLQLAMVCMHYAMSFRRVVSASLCSCFLYRLLNPSSSLLPFVSLAGKEFMGQKLIVEPAKGERYVCMFVRGCWFSHRAILSFASIRSPVDLVLDF